MTARSIARTSGSSESRAYFGGPCVPREALSLNFVDSKTNGFSRAVSLRVLLVPGITGAGNEVRHPSLGSLMSSVVSVRSSDWNQSFTGHESNNFTSPLFRGFVVRFRMYSPRSMRSISSSCPDLMSSSRRNSAGRMIWPFVVLMKR